MTRQRLAELMIMLMIGKGIVIALNPQWHLRLWQLDSPTCRKVVDEFSQRPHLTRTVGVLTAVLGVVLVMQQERH